MKMHNLNPIDFIMDEIESIELIGDKETVDISVEDTHMFYANDIYTHNSAVNEDIIMADKISNSYEKIMIADFVMSVSRKPGDKIGKQARVHIVKNRYGPDGETCPAKFDADNGNIILYEPTSIEGKEEQSKMGDNGPIVKKFLQSRYEEFNMNKKKD